MIRLIWCAERLSYGVISEMLNDRVRNGDSDPWDTVYNKSQHADTEYYGLQMSPIAGTEQLEHVHDMALLKAYIVQECGERTAGTSARLTAV